MAKTIDPEAAKRAAIEQWTADPCGTGHVGSEPGGEKYFRELLAMREDYAPWMAEEIGYAESAGLDVLDVGCGQGIDLARYAMAGARATGIDLTPRHVELARLHLAALGLEGSAIVGDAERMPFEDASFDRASSNGVLHHTPDILGSLREIHRVLRPGGRATIIVYNRSSLHYWLHQFAVHGVLCGELVRERGMAGVLSANVEHSTIGARPLVRVYGRRELAAIMREAGFDSVEIGVRHYRVGDTLLTRVPSRWSKALRDRDRLDRIGRRAGWYLIARGHRPAAADPR
jgi:ubiquinone/menaquinone biosynthesis C-methylase UbiE